MLDGTAIQTSRNPTVTISVLTYNRMEILGSLLNSLQAIAYRPLEIIVVDNHSGDGTGEMVRTRYPEVRYLRTPENLGATARNLGLQSATGEVVITLDDDVMGINDQSITCILGYFDRNPLLGAVNFKVLDHVRGEVCNWVHHYPVEDYGDREFSTYEITEGASAFRQEAVARVGYYPEAFFMSHEGPDLALRLLGAGYQVIYSPRVVVVHCHAASGRKSWYNYYFDTRNQFWLAARNFPGCYCVRYLCLGLLSMLAYSLRDGFFRYWLRGIFDGLRGLPTACKQRAVVSERVMSLVREIDRQRPGVRDYVRIRLFKKNARL